MNRSHLDIILAPLLIVAILVSTWLFAIEPLSKTERAIESQRVVVGAANAALAAKVGVLSKQNDSINTYKQTSSSEKACSQIINVHRIHHEHRNNGDH